MRLNKEHCKISGGASVNTDLTPDHGTIRDARYGVEALYCWGAGFMILFFRQNTGMGNLLIYEQLAGRRYGVAPTSSMSKVQIHGALKGLCAASGICGLVNLVR
jgi:hypothetical protein